MSGASVVADGAVLLPPSHLHVARGESVALRGPNGAGKTTVLRLIAGHIRPSAGTVRVAGRPVDDRAAGFRCLVAGVIGAPPLARDLTVREHLALIGTTWGLGVGRAYDVADAVCEELGLAGLEGRFPHELSSGQRQLAGLATALVRPCEVLLLDEPEQALDAAHVTAVAAALRRRRADGIAILLATHSDRLADEASDRTVELAAA